MNLSAHNSRRFFLGALSSLGLISIVKEGWGATADAVLFQNSAANFLSEEFSKSGAGARLDLGGFSLKWEDDFSFNSVVDDKVEYSGISGPKWFSPGHPASKKNNWVGPSDPANVVGVADGNLVIKLVNRGGAWYSSCVQSVDRHGKGFAESEGYWEMRAKFPKGKGTWPAFWIYTLDRLIDDTKTNVEYDIIEAYGNSSGDQGTTHTSVHLVPSIRLGGDPKFKRVVKGNITRTGSNLFDGDWHTYGGMVTRDWIVTYFDGREIARLKSFPEALKPKYVLVDLHRFDEGRDLDPSKTYEMVVDYVKFYQKK